MPQLVHVNLQIRKHSETFKQGGSLFHNSSSFKTLNTLTELTHLLILSLCVLSEFYLE